VVVEIMQRIGWGKFDRIKSKYILT
jgi:hypothetical protein